MSEKKNIIAVIVSALLITGFFHRQALELNLLISETVLFAWMLIPGQYIFKGLYPITIGLGLIIISIFTVLIHSIFLYIINLLIFFLFIGILIYPNAKSLLNTFSLAFLNILNSQVWFLKEISASKLKGKKLIDYIRGLNIFVIPVIIIIVFIVIYRGANPVFNKLVVNIGMFIQEKLSFIFDNFDFCISITFLISILISIFILFRTSNKQLIEIDKYSIEQLERQKRQKRQIF